MKKLVFLIFSIVLIFGLTGCSSNKTEDMPVFETDNISSVAFHFIAPGSEEIKVPDKHLDEIVQWLGSFTVGDKIDGVLPPGADSIFVSIEYSDGTVVENSTSTVNIDGTLYLINYDKEPECYFDMFTGAN